MSVESNTYDQYADQYAALLQRSSESPYSLYHDLVVPQVLQFLGNIAGHTVLDAGCGEGFLARLLAGHGAQVTAVDISARLVSLAKLHDPAESVQYLVHDLSKGFPDAGQTFELVVSNLVLNDVYDYGGYIATLGEVTKPGGRVVVAMNNPYSAVLREKAQNYYDSGVATLYGGLSKEGICVYYFHRTFEEYITAFRDAGFLLRSLSDLQRKDALPNDVARWDKLPFIIVLEMVKVPA